MKRKSLLFVLLLALMAPWAANAQTTVEIGTDGGTSTNSFLPAYTYYNNTLSEQIYTAEEVGMAGTITSISFYNGGSTKSPEIKLYLVNTDKSEFTSTTDWLTVTADNLVFDGTVTFTADEWTTIEFTNEFEYDGTSNLGVVVDEHMQWSSGLACRVFTSTDNCSLYHYDDNVNFDATNPASGYYSNRLGVKNQIILGIIPGGGGPTCDRPETVTADDVTSNSATINWAGGSGTYNMEYKKASDQEWTSALTNSTQTQFELSNLDPATDYQARVQSACGTDPETGDPVNSGWKNVSFRTECEVIATFPWIMDFENIDANTVPNCWDNSASTSTTASSTPYYVWGSYTYNNNIMLRMYNYFVQSGTALINTPTIELPNEVYQLTFDYSNRANCGAFSVKISEDGGTTFTELQSFASGTSYSYTDPGTFTEATISLADYAGKSVILQFYALANYGSGAIFVDNIIIDTPPTCPKPTSLAYSDVTGHTANLTWTPGAEGQTQWQICLNGDEDNLILVNSAEGAYTLTGLTGQTPYTAKVRAYCGETDQSYWSNQVSFTTTVTCVTPTGLTATSSYTTNHSATLNWTSDASEWILAYKLYSAHDSTYVNVPVNEKPYILDGLTPETRYMVRVRANCGEEDGLSNWSYTTNFTTLGAYPAPNNLTCDSTFAYSAYFSWFERGSATDWQVAYKLATDTAYTTELTPDNHTFMLGDFEPLTPGTDYVLKVRSIYFTEQGDTTSAWSNEVAFTTLQTCPAPTEVVVYDSTITAYSATLNWHSNYSDSWNVKYRTPAYMIGTEENFNASSSNAPQGWTRYNALLSDVLGGGSLGNEITYGWNFNNTNVFGANHAKLNIYGTSVKTWLVTPELTLADGPAMSFDLALTAYNSTGAASGTCEDDKFVVLIYANDTWTILREWNTSGSEYVYNTIATTGENVSIDLSAYQGQTVQIAFYGESTVSGNGDNDLHIDNVSIGTPVAATEWTEVAADAVPFELTGLNPETYYEVVVTSNCGEETSEESASVFFTTTPSCLAPTELAVANESVTAHAATLSWTENGSATEWVIEYTAVVNDSTIVTNAINVTENPYMLTGLLAETPYAVKVKAYCSETDQSGWSNTARFVTLVACPAPTELAVDEESITTNGATLTWNGTSDNYILQMADLSTASVSDEPVVIFSEGFEGGSMPTGWINQGNWVIGSGDQYSSSTHSGTYNAKADSYTSSPSYLIMPALDLTSYSNAKLTCWYLNSLYYDDWYYDYYYDEFGVYYRTSNNGEWVELFNTTTYHYSWTQTSQLSLPSEAYVQIGFKFVSEDGYGVGLDDILIEGNPFAYEWTTFDSEATSPYTFEDLTPGTDYMFRVIGDCGEDGESVPSAAISFTTVATCLVPTDFAATDVTAHTATMVWNGENDSYVVNYRVAAGTNVIFEEDFENGNIGDWNFTSMNTENIGGTYGAGVSSDAHSGSYGFRFSSYSSADDYNQYLVSPELNMTGELKFYAKKYSTYADYLYVGYSTTNNAVEDFTWSEELGLTSSWKEYTLNLPADVKYIAFHYYGNYTYYAYVDDITISEPVPAGEWMTATAADTTVVLNSLLAATTYDAMVQAVCTEDDSSAFTDIITFTTTVACPAITSLDTVSVGAHEAVISWVETGEATAWQICLNGDEDNLIEVVANTENDTITYTLEGLAQDADITVAVRANCGDEDGTSIWSTLTFHTDVACARPTNLNATDITNKTARLSWEGESEYYVVQYNAWHQVGSDITTTGVMKPYTFDLSDYSGTGSIAIRHYDISDVWYLNIDDIVVKNAQDSIVFAENFENGSIPSTMTNLDYDNDGNGWLIRGSGTDNYNNNYVNGNYGATSASYMNSYGPLNPDNWLIINNVELGGSLTLEARGQDPDYPAENFGVFVFADNEFEQNEEEADENELEIVELESGTIYEWRVKGVCDEDESQWASSSFMTLENLKTFVKNGNWNDSVNWNPGGVPTFENKVQIDSAAYIPAGVVAQAKKATLGTEGSITIADGGQLKQGSASLKVTMEKAITGYGEGNDKWNLISSPFNGRTNIGYMADWNSVAGLAEGTYDFYALEPLMPYSEDWLNYKDSGNEEHELFDGGMLFGEGYLFARQDTDTLIYTGTTWSSYNAYMTKDCLYYPDSLGVLGNGWKLVGNPYTCDVYLSFVDQEGDPLEANFYVMNATGDGFELAETGDALPPLTGAFVNFNTTGYVQYASEQPDASKYSRTGKFVMSLSQGDNTVDKAVIRFGKGMSLEKMSFNDNSSKLYITADGRDFAVVYNDKAATTPVSFKAETAGSYTINFAADGVSFKELVLVDNVNNTKVDLLANPSYTFETEAGEFAGRFTIVYRVK